MFAGSSSTYWNDLPHAVATAVNKKVIGHSGDSVTAEIVGRSGDDIRVYLEPGFDRYQYGVKDGQTFLQKIEQEKPELLVLQVVCGFVLKDARPDGASPHADAVTRYCEAVRAAGGEPVFYEMGWGKTEREAEGRARIFELAVKNRVRFYAPCSTAWARVYREKPDLAFQHPKDGAHPGDAGHFLNVACFTAALTGQSPVGKLPRTYPVWPHGLGKPTAEQRAAEEIEIARFRPNIYQAKMPGWMRRNMAKQRTATLDDATATYLETVAWETWQDVNKRLTAAGGMK